MPALFLVLVMCCEILYVTGSAAQEHAPEHHWDYGPTRGPSHWAELSPEFRTCSIGHRQSPIDIRDTQKADLPPIVFEYKPSPLRIVDNGHTVMINYAPGSYMAIGEQRYQLKQFHFHKPSEEKLNGKGYPNGLSGPEIPVQAKMMTICDIFDALSASDRPYKRAVPTDRALDILKVSVHDGEIDAELFRLFVDAGVFRIISKPA